MPDDTTPQPVPAAPAPVTDPTPTPSPVPAPAPTAPPAPAGSEAHPRPDGVSDAEWSALGDPGKAALVRERQRVAAAEARIREYETRDMSELEKAQREAAENKTAAEKATTEALRLRLATRHGLSEADAELFLVGTDEATLTAQAERVAGRLAGQQPPPPRIPAPDPGQGPRPQDPPSEDDQTYEALYGAQIRK